MKYLLMLFTILLSINLYSTTYHIKLDGSGDFATIQEGIDAAANNDSVLVYPGIYYENLELMEKDVILASLYVQTEQDSFIYQTVIDAGYNDDNCLTILYSDNSSFIGFTARHGKGNSEATNGRGGGIFVYESTVDIIACHIRDNNAFSIYDGGGLFAVYSSLNIIDCKIENNRARRCGGGAYINDSQVYLSNTIIKNNHAIDSAGGLMASDTDVVFDSINRCSIFFNYAGAGNDYSNVGNTSMYNLIVDTFTVQEPTEHFLWSFNEISFDIQHHVLDQVEHDLYVSPEGDNLNSGLTPDEPLQTLHYALSKIKADSLNPRTIFLADGIYSHNLNNQLFSLNHKAYVSIIGESKEGTILDGEDSTSFFYISSKDPFSKIENLTMRNGYNLKSPIYVNRNPYFEAKHLIIENMHILYEPAGIDIYEVDNYYLENITVRNGIGRYSILGVRSNGVINNCRIESICSDGPPYYRSCGGGIYMIDCDSVIINNTIVARCTTETDMGYLFSGIGLSFVDNAYLSNCTLLDNKGSIPLLVNPPLNGASIKMNNCIVHNNIDIAHNSSILIGDYYSHYPVELSISYSCVEDGELGVFVYEGANYNWLEGNISDDPMFDLNSNYTGYLQPGSPCIDAGTPDTTGLHLPPWDILGNPRIYGGRIDMGCYEWNPDDITGEYRLIPKSESTLYNYPNPFNPVTTIFYNVPEFGKVELNIYNVRGQLIRKLINKDIDSGQHSVIWDGRNDIGESLSSGVYFYKLETENQPALINKMVLLK